MRRIQVRVIVTGNVQGVGYRGHTQREAAKIGVNGWVRNLADGTVEAVFSGTQDAVDRMVNWCRRGPLCVHVTEISVEKMPMEAFHGFDVR